MAYHLTNARSRAKLFGLEFSISLADIVVPPNCPGCGCALELGEGRKKKSSVSVDRLDSLRGYTVENVWVLCYCCNRSKNNSSPQLMIATLAEMCRRRMISRDDVIAAIDVAVQAEQQKAAS